jgi:hypothetical protein
VKTLTVGCLAYLDSFSGLIPCRVLSIGQTGVNVEITARRAKAYRRGERLFGVSSSRVVSRKSVFVRNGQYRIRVEVQQ